jgi:hypothetical protein
MTTFASHRRAVYPNAALVALLITIIVFSSTAQAELHPLFGWPKVMDGDVNLWWRTAAVLDLDANSDWELSFLTTEGALYIYQHDGANYPGSPLAPYQGDRLRAWERSSHPATVAIGDVDGDHQPDLVYTTDIGYLHVVPESGREPPQFPVDYGRARYAGIPVTLDLDGDGEVEIIFHSYSLDPDSADAEAVLHIYSSTGEPFAEWPIHYPRGSTSSPSVGDIDYDGQCEIVTSNAATDDEPAQILVWHQNGLQVDGFPAGNLEAVGGAPTLADLDGDGRLEILVWATEREHGNSGIFAWNHSGQLLNRFPLPTRAGHPDGSPLVADIGGDRLPEIIFGSFDPDQGAQIYAWSSNGVPLDSFPINTGAPSVVGTPVIADVSGDGVNDIVAAMSPSEGGTGWIGAWDDHGRMVDDFPLELESGAFAGPPTVWDLNRDGRLDLIAVTTDRKVMVWETPGRVNWDWWPTYKGGFHRTGVRPEDEPYRAPPLPKTLLPQVISFTAYPNPFNSAVLIKLALPYPANSLTMELLDPSGRMVSRLYQGAADAGQMVVPIDAAALEIPAGTYFCRLRLNHTDGIVPIHYLR